MSLPTNVVTGTEKEHFHKISINEIGRRSTLFYLREERQSKVDAFAVMHRQENNNS
jgi:hypothetical protein